MSEGIGHEFYERTKFGHIEIRLHREEGRPAEEKPFSGKRIFDLPPPGAVELPPLDFFQLLQNRSSVRHYSARPLTLAELSFLLWATQGIRARPRPGVTLRTVPSAGARHAFETALLVIRAEGLEPGLYRYLAGSHRLGALEGPADPAQAIFRAALEQQMILTAAATFLWTALPARMTWRYGDRGYRYLYLDAGHVGQNLYLAAEAIGCGACAIAAFDDDAVNETLGLDGVEEFVIYMASVGHKPQ